MNEAHHQIWWQIQFNGKYKAAVKMRKLFTLYNEQSQSCSTSCTGNEAFAVWIYTQGVLWLGELFACVTKQQELQDTPIYFLFSTEPWIQKSGFYAAIKGQKKNFSGFWYKYFFSPVFYCIPRPSCSLAWCCKALLLRQCLNCMT